MRCMTRNMFRCVATAVLLVSWSMALGVPDLQRLAGAQRAAIGREELQLKLTELFKERSHLQRDAGDGSTDKKKRHEMERKIESVIWDLSRRFLHHASISDKAGHRLRIPLRVPKSMQNSCNWLEISTKIQSMPVKMVRNSIRIHVNY